MSFVDTLANLITTLETDEDLASFALNVWGKPLTVKAGFKTLAEIGLDEFPTIRITAPEDDPDTNSGNRIVMHTVRLYCGFFQDDVETAVSETIMFKELIRSALLKDKRRGQTAQTTIPGPTVTDEGRFHPTHSQLMDISIQTNDLV